MPSLNHFNKLSDKVILLKDERENFYLQFIDSDLTIRVKPNGYIPKSGLLFIDYLSEIPIAGSVLDLGTGETGILAHYAYKRGAERVVGVDLDKSAIQHVLLSTIIQTPIQWLHGDLFEPLQESTDKFNIIISNPPQMPTQNGENLHDTAGIDGREIIVRIIKDASKYLFPNGKLYILCFDFLGILTSYNEADSLKEIADVYNFETKIVAEFIREIRPGGKTEESVLWIKTIYPRYRFKKTPGKKLSHKIYIVEFTFK